MNGRPGRGPGSVQFCAYSGRIGAVGDEYRICTPVGVEHTMSVAMLFGQKSLHPLPVAGFRPRCGAGAFRCDSLQEIQCLAEPATGGMQCQVDRPSTAQALDVDLNL